MVVSLADVFDELAGVYGRQAAAREAVEGLYANDVDGSAVGDSGVFACCGCERCAAGGTDWDVASADLAAAAEGLELSRPVPDAKVVPYLRAVNSLLMHAGALDAAGIDSGAAIEQAAMTLLNECGDLAAQARSMRWQRDDIESQLADVIRERDELRSELENAEHDARELELELEAMEHDRDSLAAELERRADVGPMVHAQGSRVTIDAAGAVTIDGGTVTIGGELAGE